MTNNDQDRSLAPTGAAGDTSSQNAQGLSMAEGGITRPDGRNPTGKFSQMTKNDEDGGRSLAKHGEGAVKEHGNRALRDPIAMAVEIISGDDPSVGELAAFRRQPIDLKAAARNAKSLSNEEFRLNLAKELGEREYDLACAGLQIMSLSLIALTAIWPADDVDQAEAKLALAEATGALHHRRDKSFVSTMDATLARRTRAS